MFGFCQDVDKATRGVKMSLILYKNSNVNNLFGTANLPNNNAMGAHQLYLQSVKLWTPTIKPDLRTQQRLENAVAQGYVQKLNYRAINCYKSPVFQNMGTVNSSLYI